MLQAVNLTASNAPCCGVPEGRCLPCSGVSGRKTIVYSCSYQGHRRVHSLAKIRGLRCVFLCEARRNPEFSRQNKNGFSRSKNRQNEARGNFEEDMLSSKNGPLTSLSSIPKSQATAAPGPREKEIVELFRKVQSRLRERAAIKEEKKVETSKGQGKENGTVDSLLKLLRKHSVEQVKRGSGGGGGKDFNLNQFQDSNQSNEGQSTWLSDSDSASKHESQEASTLTVNRPPSNFQRRSPVPRLKYQLISYDEDDENEIPLSNGNNQDRSSLELDAETELDAKDELFYSDEGIAGLLEDDSHDTEQTFNNEGEEQQQVIELEDLNALKLSELRALAKARGLKGFSKMKKGELLELLS